MKKYALCDPGNGALPSIGLLPVEGVAQELCCMLNGANISLAFKLEFSYTNNEVEYAALVTGLTIALNMGIQRLRV